MNAPFSALNIFEMFYGVGDVSRASIDPRRPQMIVEQLSRWADEGSAFDILLIARLFAHDHQGSVLRPFTHDGVIIQQSDRAFATG